MEKDNYFRNGAEAIGHSQFKKMKFNPNITPCVKINFK